MTMGIVASSDRPAGPVLVIEDDADVRAALLSLFASHGYRVAEAANGIEALRLLRSTKAPPCLIVLDLMTPRLNGWDFFATRNRDDRLRAIPVIVVSADPLAEQAVRLGAAAVLQKPVDPVLLLGMVARYARNGR